MHLTTTDPSSIRSARNLVESDDRWPAIVRCNEAALLSDELGWQKALELGVSEAEVAAAEASLASLSAGADEATIKRGLMYVGEVLGAKPLTQRQVAGYVSLLTDVPAGLLPLALRRVSTMDGFHTMPTPGAILQQVRTEMQAMKDMKARLHRLRSRIQVARRATRPRPPPAPAPPS